MSHKNMNLFDDDDEEDILGDVEPEEFDLHLEEKLNRSERKTSKLIELQSKFAHDSRFKIGEHFLGDDEDEEQTPKTEIEEEKSKNLAILEQVLGKRIHQSTPYDAVNEFRKKTAAQSDRRHSMKTFTKGPATTVFNTVLTPRFDPTKVESKIYELEGESKKRKVNIDFDELEKREAKGSKKAKKEPGTSTSTDSNALKVPTTEPTTNYYEVSTNLKDTLAGAEDFSLGSFLGLNSFEEPSKAVKAANERATYEPISALEKKKLKTLRNPFKYDSSDEEDDFRAAKWNDQEEKDYDQEDEDQEVTIKVAPTPQILSAFGGFFFRADDPRLKQDLFYAPELIEKARTSGKERSMAMMRALSFRKKAAQKNVKSDEKFAKKRKLMRQNAKGKRGAQRRRFQQRQMNGGSRPGIGNRGPRSLKPEPVAIVP